MKIRFRFERSEELKYIGHLMSCLFESVLNARTSGCSFTGLTETPYCICPACAPGLSGSGEFADVELEKRYELKHIFRKAQCSTA